MPELKRGDIVRSKYNKINTFVVVRVNKNTVTVVCNVTDAVAKPKRTTYRCNSEIFEKV